MPAAGTMPSPARWADDTDDTDLPPLPEGWYVAEVSLEDEWKTVPARRRENRVPRGLNNTEGSVIIIGDVLNLNKIRYKKN